MAGKGLSDSQTDFTEWVGESDEVGMVAVIRVVFLLFIRYDLLGRISDRIL